MQRHASKVGDGIGETARHPDDHARFVAAVRRGASIWCTADEMAEAIGRADQAREVQHQMEDLVATGMLERWGVGRGALYRAAAAENSLTMAAEKL